MNYGKIYNAVNIIFNEKWDSFYKNMDPRVVKLYKISSDIDLSNCRQYKLKMTYDKNIIYVSGIIPADNYFIDTILLEDELNIVIFVDAITNSDSDGGFINFIYKTFTYIINLCINPYVIADPDSMFYKIAISAPFVMTIKTSIEILKEAATDELFESVLETTPDMISIIKGNDIEDLLIYGAFSN